MLHYCLVFFILYYNILYWNISNHNKPSSHILPYPVTPYHVFSSKIVPYGFSPVPAARSPTKSETVRSYMRPSRAPSSRAQCAVKSTRIKKRSCTRHPAQTALPVRQTARSSEEMVAVSPGLLLEAEFLSQRAKCNGDVGTLASLVLARASNPASYRALTGKGIPPLPKYPWSNLQRLEDTVATTTSARARSPGSLRSQCARSQALVVSSNAQT